MEPPSINTTDFDILKELLKQEQTISYGQSAAPSIAREANSEEIIDLARTFYDSARSEIVARIGLRDNILLLYLGAVGTVFGLALGTTISIDPLLVIPFLSLGASTIISQHNAIIGALSSYCSQEIQYHLDRYTNYNTPTQWENSLSLQEYHIHSINLRLIGHAILMLAPPLIALLIHWPFIVAPTPLENLVWWIGTFCVLASAWFILSAHVWRMKLYKRRKWHINHLKDHKTSSQ